MPSFDADAALAATLAQSKDLAATLFKKYVKQATADTEAFLNSARVGIERAGLLYAAKRIDQDDFEDLILGKKDLAEMHALKQTGLAHAAVDTFTNGVLNILVDAALAAVKF